MENIKIISSFTKKLSLAVLERNGSISQKFGEFLDKLFENISYTKFQEDLYENKVDIIIVDLATQDKDSNFNFIKKLKDKNPYVKILVYSLFSDIFVLQNCIRYDVSGFLTDESTKTDLKSFIKNCIEKISITVNNKLLNHDFPNLSIQDCIDYLANDRDSNVTVVSHYKGLPIIKDALIIYFDEKSVTLKVQELQLRSLNKNDNIALCSEFLGKDILTTVKDIDEEKLHIELTYNDFIDTFVHHRKNLRLDAEDTSQLVLIDQNRRKIKTKALNISTNHILCDIVNYNEFKIHSKLNISLKLNDRMKVLQGTAIVKDIFNTNNGYKMLMRFTFIQAENQALDNYLSLRVKKLINELKK